MASNYHSAYCASASAFTHTVWARYVAVARYLGNILNFTILAGARLAEGLRRGVREGKGGGWDSTDGMLVQLDIHAMYTFGNALLSAVQLTVYIVGFFSFATRFFRSCCFVCAFNSQYTNAVYGKHSTV